MELQCYGANCLVASSKSFRLVADDNLAELGGKTISKEGDVLLQTNPTVNLAAVAKPKLLINGPGEYEVSGVSINGIAARAHTDEVGGTSATMYKLIYNDLSVLITGHVFPELNESQLEQVGEVDAMFVPAGGGGYTLDPTGALELVKLVEPKLVIPTHYDDKALKYEVPQQPIDKVVKELGMEPRDTTSKLKLKAGELSDITQLVVLEKS